MKYLSALIFTILLFASCQNVKKEQRELPADSIFRLSSQWENQNGETMELQELRGNTLVVVMIYTSCKTACPVLVARMKAIEEKIARKDLDKISFVLVSIDPKVDTPKRLQEFAIKNKMDGKQWIFLRSNEEATQEFANVLSMKYKQISPIDFSHSNIVTVFDPEGHMVSQEEGLDINVDKVAKTVTETVKEFK